jgi:hypothetical protein
MNRTVNKFTLMPVLNPSCVLYVIIDGTFPFFKQRFVHVAFGGSNNQFELLIRAVVAVFAGMVIVNVTLDVLSEPKSKTAIDLLPWVEL